MDVTFYGDIQVRPFGRCARVTALSDTARLCLTLGIAGPTLRRDIPDFAIRA